MSVAVQTISLHSPSPVSSVGLPLQEDDDALGQLRSQHQRAFPKRPAPTFTLGGRPQPRVSTSAAPRSNRTSFFISARSNALATVCSDPKILTCLLSSLTFQDFRSLNATSKAIRRIFLDAPIKDVVFARFIPGYRAALRWRDSRMWEDTFRLNYTDLSLLGESPSHLSLVRSVAYHLVYSLFNARHARNLISRVIEYTSSPLPDACAHRALK